MIVNWYRGRLQIKRGGGNGKWRPSVYRVYLQASCPTSLIQLPASLTSMLTYHHHLHSFQKSQITTGFSRSISHVILVPLP